MLLIGGPRRRAYPERGPDVRREGDGVSAADQSPISRDTAEEYAHWFQALSDPTRIVILSYLSRQDGAVSVGTIVTELQIGQSTVSHHLKTLLEVGFVSRTRDRTARLYAVNRNCITRFPAAADVIMGLESPGSSLAAADPAAARA
jgi:DNA-binding transcriptional ArsR family regulator